MRPRRLVLAVCAVALALLFIAPVRAYRSAQQHLNRAEVELVQARADHARLARQQRAAGSRAALIVQARELGYVFPGETPYAVERP